MGRKDFVVYVVIVILTTVHASDDQRYEKLGKLEKEVCGSTAEKQAAALKCVALDRMVSSGIETSILTLLYNLLV